MSLGYAEKLSFKEDVGQVGMSEIFDSPRILQQKIEELASLIKKSKHLVVFTGAGISTSCGIPDFRGPKGIWTLQKKGKALPQASLPFHRAMPSITHMALVELEKAGILKFVISQNVDGLHLRSGIPRRKLSELHGNSFMEICPSCDSEYFRDFEVETIGLKETTRNCSNIDCGARLKDMVLDWEDELPSKEMNLAELHCKQADLVLCLGTSLQITPACNLPLKCLRGKGKIVIVNLQKTPKDKKASVVIRGFTDKVIAGVMDLLNLQIPPYVRIDLFQIIFTHEPTLDDKYKKWILQIASAHDLKAPLSFVSSVEVSFDEELNINDSLLDNQPFQLERTVTSMYPFDILLKLNFSDGCGCEFTIIKIPIDFQAREENFTFEKEAVLEKLQRKATKKLSCGENEVIERKFIASKKSQIITYATVTNISVFDTASIVSEIVRKSKSSLKRQNESENGIVKSSKKSKGLLDKSAEI